MIDFMSAFFFLWLCTVFGFLGNGVWVVLEFCSVC